MAASRVHCLVCGGADHRVLHRFATHRVLRCPACTLVWIDPVPAQAQLVRWAEEGHEGHPFAGMERYFVPPRLDDASAARPLLAILDALARAAPGRTLLDVGCGTGYFAALARDRGWTVTAVDVSRAAAASARAAYGIEVVTSIFPDAGILRAGFDAIALLDVLEHVTDPPATMRRVRELLAPGGVVVIDSPNHASLLCAVMDRVGRLPIAAIRRKLAQYYHRAHVTVLTPRSLTMLLGATGFEIVAQAQDSPMVDRFDLSPSLTIAVRGIERIARLVAMQSRCRIIARARD